MTKEYSRLERRLMTGIVSEHPLQPLDHGGEFFSESDDNQLSVSEFRAPNVERCQPHRLNARTISVIRPVQERVRREAEADNVVRLVNRRNEKENKNNLKIAISLGAVAALLVGGFGVAKLTLKKSAEDVIPSAEVNVNVANDNPYIRLDDGRVVDTSVETKRVNRAIEVILELQRQGKPDGLDTSKIE